MSGRKESLLTCDCCKQPIVDGQDVAEVEPGRVVHRPYCPGKNLLGCRICSPDPCTGHESGKRATIPSAAAKVPPFGKQMDADKADAILESGKQGYVINVSDDPSENKSDITPESGLPS